jgi:hypothetical protein
MKIVPVATALFATFLVAGCATRGAETDHGGQGGADTEGSHNGSSHSNGTTTTSSTSSEGPPCPDEGPPLDPTGYPQCPSYICGGGARCIPKGAVGPDMAGFLEPCNDEFLCVPDLFIATKGNFLLESCIGIMGLEGRCISDCIPMVADQADRLTQTTCSEGELCAPCFDPFSLEPTGACALTCDEGPVEPAPEPLPTCCPENNGTCVSADALPSEAISGLAQDSCPEASMKCVPNEMLDPDFSGTPCEPDKLLQHLGIDEGVCLPECVDAVKTIGRGSCPGGYKCAPCNVLGNSTGACDDPW